MREKGKKDKHVKKITSCSYPYISLIFKRNETKFKFLKMIKKNSKNNWRKQGIKP